MLKETLDYLQRDHFDTIEGVYESVHRCVLVYVLYNPHGIRFSTLDIFIQDDLILMKATVTHKANLCNSLYIMLSRGKMATKSTMFW